MSDKQKMIDFGISLQSALKGLNELHGTNYEIKFEDRGVPAFIITEGGAAPVKLDKESWRRAVAKFGYPSDWLGKSFIGKNGNEYLITGGLPYADLRRGEGNGLACLEIKTNRNWRMNKNSIKSWV